MRPLKRDCVLLLIGLFCFAGVSLSTLAEQPDLSQSSKGYRAYQDHRAALHDLTEGYFRSLDTAADRFAKSSIAHIRRYTDGLNRAKTKQARAGNDSAVIFIEALIDLSASWTITAPDAEGKHFLSDADLVVEGDDEATKLGTDLIARIDRLAPSYQRQADSVFARYEKDVQSAWKAYIKALEKVRLEELKAGRHKSVIQVEDALEALKNQGEIKVERPTRHQDQDDPAEDILDEERGPIGDGDGDGEGDIADTMTVKELADKGYPESMHGIYVVQFPNSRSASVERLIMVLREDGAEVVGWYYQFDEENKYKLETSKATLLERDGDLLMFHAKSAINRDMFFKIHTDSSSYGGHFWTSVEDFRARETGRRAMAYKLYQSSEQKTLKDGKYELQMEASTDPDRNAAEGKVTIQVEVIGGQLFRPTQRCKIGKRNWTLAPAGFTHIPLQGYTHFFSSSYYAPQNEAILVRTTDDPNPVVKIWWDNDDRREGLPPNMTGKVVPVKEEPAE